MNTDKTFPDEEMAELRVDIQNPLNKKYITVDENGNIKIHKNVLKYIYFVEAKDRFTRIKF